ncbi:MAG: hypothetical protein VX726_10260, partial [Planctomycetota bacterium]|nr:hypothetical protein [Planctomycetota bacterium]
MRSSPSGGDAARLDADATQPSQASSLRGPCPDDRRPSDAREWTTVVFMGGSRLRDRLDRLELDSGATARRHRLHGVVPDSLAFGCRRRPVRGIVPRGGDTGRGDTGSIDRIEDPGRTQWRGLVGRGPEAMDGAQLARGEQYDDATDQQEPYRDQSPTSVPIEEPTPRGADGAPGANRG